MKEKKPVIIAVANEKGGVAKTTTAVNVSAGLSKQGKKVLLIDIDSQYHLSDWLDYSPDGKPAIAELIYQTVASFEVDVKDFIRHNFSMNVDYIPANAMLAGIISIIETATDRALVFKKMFSDEFFENYDYIIIDCPASLNLLVTNAINCSDKLLIPVQTDALAYKGTNKMLTTYLRIKPSADIEKDVMILPTMYHKNTTVSREVYQALIDSYKDMVIKQPIPYRASAVSSSVDKTAVVGKKTDIGQAYEMVVKSILGGVDNE